LLCDCTVYLSPPNPRISRRRIHRRDPPCSVPGGCATGGCREAAGSPHARPHARPHAGQVTGLKLREETPGFRGADPKHQPGSAAPVPPRSPRGCMGHGPPRVTTPQPGHHAGTLPARPSRAGCPRRANHHRPLLVAHAHRARRERAATHNARRGRASRAPAGPTSRSVSVPSPHRKGYRSRGCSQPRGEVPEDGVQPSHRSRPLPELLHRAPAARALSPSLTLREQPGRSRAPLASATFASAAHAPAAVHAQRGRGNPARSQGLAGFADGRACWRLGRTWAKLSAGFLRGPLLPVCFPFSASSYRAARI